MNVRTQVIITQVNHYDMDGNQGVSVRTVGNYEETDNKFGLSISEAGVPNVGELNTLKRHKRQLPARFNVDVSFGTKKASNGKEITAVTLSNFEFVESMEFVPKAPVNK